MLRTVACLAAAAIATPSVGAQEWRADATATVVMTALNGSGEIVSAPLLADTSLFLAGETVLDNGVTVTLDLEARLRFDRPRADTLSPGPQTADPRIAAAVEIASIALAGPLGEARIGFDTGAASRLDARPPRVLNQVFAASSGLDPTGLGVAQSRNDASGTSFKATALSPRWLGVRLGASYTPAANRPGVDYVSAPLRPGGPPVREIAEAALSVQRRLNGGPDIRAAITALSAEVGPGERAQSLGVGLEADTGKWSGGARWRSANPAAAGARASALEASLVRRWGEGWSAGLEYAETTGGGPRARSGLIALRRSLPSGVDLGVGLLTSRARPSSAAAAPSPRAYGIVLEASVRYE
jgi:hypothetical protein